MAIQSIGLSLSDTSLRSWSEFTGILRVRFGEGEDEQCKEESTLVKEMNTEDTGPVYVVAVKSSQGEEPIMPHSGYFCHPQKLFDEMSMKDIDSFFLLFADGKHIVWNPGDTAILGDIGLCPNSKSSHPARYKEVQHMLRLTEYHWKVPTEKLILQRAIMCDVSHNVSGRGLLSKASDNFVVASCHTRDIGTRRSQLPSGDLKLLDHGVRAMIDLIGGRTGKHISNTGDPTNKLIMEVNFPISYVIKWTSENSSMFSCAVHNIISQGRYINVEYLVEDAGGSDISNLVAQTSFRVLSQAIAAAASIMTSSPTVYSAFSYDKKAPVFTDLGAQSLHQYSEAIKMNWACHNQPDLQRVAVLARFTVSNEAVYLIFCIPYFFTGTDWRKINQQFNWCFDPRGRQ